MRVYTDDIKYEDLKSLKQYLRSLKDRRVIKRMGETHIILNVPLKVNDIFPLKTPSIPKKEQTVYLSGDWIENDIGIIDYTDKSGNNYIRIATPIDEKPMEIQRFYRLRSFRTVLGSALLLRSEDAKTIYGKCSKEQKVSDIATYINPRGFTSYIGRVNIDVAAITNGFCVLYMKYRDWYEGDTDRSYGLVNGKYIFDDVIKIEPNSEIELSIPFCSMGGEIRIDITIVETFNDQ